ncbi:MAG: hypothetical protein PHI12_11285 [Dehalococcoidales bacterium]|nr:hypothetical protein [Dehalococcoidales bacterium]
METPELPQRLLLLATLFLLVTGLTPPFGATPLAELAEQPSHCRKIL